MQIINVVRQDFNFHSNNLFKEIINKKGDVYQVQVNSYYYRVHKITYGFGGRSEINVSPH